jgi:type IV pilus assembly protein PilX
MRKRTSQTGVVLIMSMLMLVLVSLLATTTMKSALSSEAVSAGVRQNQLAHQAAEAALQFCEAAALAIARGETPGPAAQAYANPPLWRNMATTWDQSNAAVYVLDLALVNSSGEPYKRPPECLIEHLAADGSAQHNRQFAVTARGFGPEVASVPNGSTDRRPAGSEVFLQSTIELQEQP